MARLDTIRRLLRTDLGAGFEVYFTVSIWVCGGAFAVFIRPHIGDWNPAPEAALLIGEALGLTLALLWLERVVRRKSAVCAGRCANCGYDLRATPDRCPECGAVRMHRAA